MAELIRAIKSSIKYNYPCSACALTIDLIRAWRYSQHKRGCTRFGWND